VTFESLNGGRVFKQKGYALLARFENLKGLQDGDDILMAGVRIGSVRQTRLAERKAEAVLSIQPGINIPNDAVAMVATSSLLGSNHLEITVGSTGLPFLQPGAEIKTRNTVDMNEVIAKLGSLGDRLEQVVATSARISEAMTAATSSRRSTSWSLTMDRNSPRPSQICRTSPPRSAAARGPSANW